MAAALANLARMTTATTGTGTITLGSAVPGFLTFAEAGITDGQEVSYAIEDGLEREVGRGVYSSSGTTLTRDVLNSTNSGAEIDLSGNAQVFITALKEDFDPLARVNEAQEWSGPQRPGAPTTLTVSSGEIKWTLASGNDFTVTLDDDAVLTLPSDIATHVGQKGRILIIQDSTGGWTFAVDEDIVPLGSEDVPGIPTDPGSMAYLAYDVISATKIVFTLTGVGE